MFMFFEKIGDKKKTRVSRGSVNVPKCVDAKYAGSKTKSTKCTMILCEGDSARGTVHEGIVNKSTKLSYEYAGTFNLNGVIMNARKESNAYKDKKTGTTRMIRNRKLQNNERLNSLVKVLGLDYEKSYDAETAEGQAELATLRYGKVVGAMDQDEDGKGNIFGLVMNFFSLFWPKLVEQRYVCRLNTPIIRLYPKAKNKFVEEFTSMRRLEDWITEKYPGDGGKERMSRDYRIKYFKGLGSHKKAEVPHMFKNFDSIICTYYLDKLGAEKLEVYFGTDTSLRKTALSTPVVAHETDGFDIPVSEQMEIDTKSYQRDNITRKMPSMVDGLVVSRRKVLCAARDVFGHTKATNKEMKVNAFVNEASKKMNYHHGEQSLAVTVTKMAQDFPGARYYPILRPEGQFGTRANGGKDFASPRYTYTKLNQRLCYQLFPPQDDYLLEYIIEDGVRCEPKHYVPIIPFAIMENVEIPAHGWKIKIWARDPADIFKNVRSLIRGEIKKCGKLRMFQGTNRSVIKTKGARKYSVGKYELHKNEDKIVVTELPLSMFSSQLIGDVNDEKSLASHVSLVRPPFDETNDDGVKITLLFKPGEMDRIEALGGKDPFDCWEEFLGLKTALDENINMFDENRAVVEFKNYHDIVDRWFAIRCAFYSDRIDREIALADLRIKYLENIIRFTKNHHKYGINPKMKRLEVDKKLKNAKYDTFNHSMLANPRYTKIAELKNLIINCPTASYDYIVNLRYSDLIEEACAKRKAELVELQNLREQLAGDIGGELPKGGKTWLRELDDLEATIRDGLEKGWDYGENKARFRSTIN